MKTAINKNIEFYIDLAKKFKNSKTWKKESPATYASAQRYGYLSECSKYMERLWEIKWNKKETVMLDAKKYTHINDWLKNSPSAAMSSKRNGWYKDCIKHMIIRSKRYENSWTREELEQYSKKYKTKTEWQQSHAASYRAAYRKGLLQELTKNYSRDTNSSKAELELLEKIIIEYPEARKQRFGSPKKGEKANYFEIDIFIESLNKGIEFNGDYWHSFEGLKRKLINWTDEEIKNYHNIKKEFFNKKGINYIEIYDSEWKQNKQVCLGRIFKFLKGEQ